MPFVNLGIMYAKSWLSPVIRAVESYYVRGVALVQDLQFSHNLLLDGWLHLEMDHLLGHHITSRFVANAMDHACSDTAQTF